ncbi:hypothetical protein [Thioclava sp. NG1]|nr:hypothetical protein [Thioclava sp. NG1]
MADEKQQKPAEAKAASAKAAGRQSMTAEDAKALGLDPTPYGKPAKK